MKSISELKLENDALCKRNAELESKLAASEARERELERLFTPENPQNMADHLSSLSGSSTCPLCGQSGVHEHSPQEIVIYRNGVKYGRYTAAPHLEFAQSQLRTLTEEKAALERQLEETKRPCHRSHPHEDDPGCPFNSEVHVSVLRANAELRSERDAALAESRKLQGDNLGLREALLKARTCASIPDYIMEIIKSALSNTSATAQETVQRIEREALKAACERANAWRNTTHDLHMDGFGLRAAILGEKP